MYGKRRSFKMTRLAAPAKKGDTSIVIDRMCKQNDDGTLILKNGKPDCKVDLTKGDVIGLAATSFASQVGERAVVKDYNADTGVVDLNEALKDYHYGAKESTASLYNGVDIRGEVVSLTRNVKVIGEDLEGWGGQILTADIFEYDDTVRSGQTIMDSIELDNMGQVDTRRAAIRFENAAEHSHSVSNCAVHNSLTWAVNVVRSAKVRLENNVFFELRAVGIGVDSSKDVVVHNNFVGHVRPRKFDPTQMKGGKAVLDRVGGILIGSLSNLK